MQEYILYGSGGHARVIKDLIEFQGDCVVAQYDSENPYQSDLFPNALMIIAVGNNEARKRISQEVSHNFGILVHPKSYVAKNVLLGEGTVILANAVLQANSKVGSHVIINANVVIDHDAVVSDFVCTYPGVYIGADVIVPELKRFIPNEIFIRS